MLRRLLNPHYLTILVVLLILALATPAHADSGDPAVYVIELESGHVAIVELSITAGEALVAAAVLLLVAIKLFDLLASTAWLAIKR
jgi:hypothetical protein